MQCSRLMSTEEIAVPENLFRIFITSRICFSCLCAEIHHFYSMTLWPMIVISTTFPRNIHQSHLRFPKANGSISACSTYPERSLWSKSWSDLFLIRMPQPLLQLWNNEIRSFSFTSGTWGNAPGQSGISLNLMMLTSIHFFRRKGDYTGLILFRPVSLYLYWYKYQYDGISLFVPPMYVGFP
jgi:hypothetical protein